MVDLLSRTAPRPGPNESERAPAPGWLAGLAAGAAMACAGVLAAMGLAVVGWLGGNSGAATGALRVGADGWLLSHGGRLRMPSGTIGLTPLGFTALIGWLAARGGRWAARAAELTRAVDVAVVAAAFAAAYTAIVLVVALVAGHPSARPDLGRTMLIAAVLTLVAAGLGGLRVVGDRTALVERIPDEVRAAWAGAIGGTLALLGCGALVLVASLVVHAGDLRDLLAALDPGAVGGLVLLVLCLAVLPNVVLLTVAVLLGPGVALGTGTSVTLSEVTVGPLPAVPWLAAVPGSGSQPAAVSALAAVPLICGLVAGVIALRRSPAYGYDLAALRGLLAGVFGGLFVAGLVAISGGPVGPGRMADVGPEAMACSAVAVAAFGIGGAIGGVGVRVLDGRRS